MTRLALIGAGRWGGNILKTLNSLPNCKVVVANNQKQTKALLKSADNFDGVLVATPGSTHAKIALPFLAKGLPVFIEKPMALNIKDAKKLEQVARKNKTHVFVGHIHLYNPAYRTLKKELPKIGQLRAIAGESMSSGPIREDMSVLWDWGPHDVAMVLDLVGSRPTKVSAVGNELQTNAKLDFGGKKKIVAFLATSWLSPEKRKRLTVFGTQGTIIFDDYAPKKIRLIRRGRETFPKYEAKSPLEVELKAFLQTVRIGSQPLTSTKNGLEVVEVLASIDRAITT